MRGRRRGEGGSRCPRAPSKPSLRVWPRIQHRSSTEPSAKIPSSGRRPATSWAHCSQLGQQGLQAQALSGLFGPRPRHPRRRRAPPPEGRRRPGRGRRPGWHGRRSAAGNCILQVGIVQSPSAAYSHAIGGAEAVCHRSEGCRSAPSRPTKGWHPRHGLLFLWLRASPLWRILDNTICSHGSSCFDSA